ncbi:MAG: PAS domain S-box protein, partial [Methanoregula sp.]|nr:PAS domain S-box protein [Methanoregula sp.]
MKREDADLKKEVENLHWKVRELEETLDAIRSGEVDAIIVSKGDTRQVYTLDGADHPYQALVENIQEGALTLSRAGMILYSNTRFAEMVQLSPDKVPGTSIFDYVCPEHCTEIEEAMCEIVKKACRIYVRIRQGAGFLPVLISMNPVSSEEDTKISVVVTDRRKDEDRIQLQAWMLNAVGDAVITVDTDHKIIFWNEAATKTYGWRPEEVIGHNAVEVGVPELAKKDARKISAQLDRGEIWSGEYRVRHRDGHEFPVQVINSPLFDDDGNLIAIIGASHDITDRKKIESEYQLRAAEYEKMNVTLNEEIRQRKLSDTTLKKTLSLLNASLESTADGIYVVDQQGKITHYNQNFVNMWNIPRVLLESAENERVMNNVLPQLKNPEGFLANIKELQSKPGRESFDMIEFKDGKIFERYSKPQKIGDIVVGRVWSFRDITDRKHAEEKLVASVVEKDVLLREIHHRVKNNLQLISGLLDMTRMGSHDESTNSILTDMMLKIQTMAQIHTRLYESKRFEKISLSDQIQDQIAGLSSIYSHKGYEISCEINSHEIFLPVDVAIPCALAMNEILSNAYKHAFVGREKGTIEISALQENGKIK